MMIWRKTKIEDRLARRYVALGLPDRFVANQVRREMDGMILRAWEAGATLRSIGERLEISVDRVKQLKNRALSQRELPSPMEKELTKDVRGKTCVTVPMYLRGDDVPSFAIKLPGRRRRDFVIKPYDHEPIRAALRARGLDPDDYWTKPYKITETMT